MNETDGYEIKHTLSFLSRKCVRILKSCVKDVLQVSLVQTLVNAGKKCSDFYSDASQELSLQLIF